MQNKIFVCCAIFSVLLFLGINQFASADVDVTITPINDKLSIKKTVIPMYIPEDNQFPWGAVRGEAAQIAERYPIIIQIYKEDDPIHFAQVEPKGDGSFEYKFRIKNIDSESGVSTNIYEGNYLVKIFRVVPNSSLPI